MMSYIAETNIEDAWTWSMLRWYHLDFLIRLQCLVAYHVDMYLLRLVKYAVGSAQTFIAKGLNYHSNTGRSYAHPIAIQVYFIQRQ